MYWRKLLLFSILAAAGVLPVQALDFICTTTAVPAMVRLEGLTEQTGDIVLNCSGAPNTTIAGSLGVYLPLNITNRLTTGNVVDAVLTLDLGSGPNSTGATPVLSGPNFLAFENLSFTLPSNGQAILRISNIRAAVAGSGATAGVPINATLTWLPGINVLFNRATIAVAVPGNALLSSTLSQLVNCQGSALPDSISTLELLRKGTAVSSTRVTEGFSEAFAPKKTGTDNGVRFILNYSNFPAGSRLFVPDAIAGSNTIQQTATGLFRAVASPGFISPDIHALLLVRIVGFNADGSGGIPLYFAPSGASGATFPEVMLLAANEVPLTGGAATVVYEVADSDPQAIESAEIPTWLGLPPTGGGAAAPHQSISIAPISTVSTASDKAPIPRFVSTEPQSDCGLQGDCAAFPAMVVTAPSLQYTAATGSGTRGDWITVANTGGGVLGWVANLTYKNGSGWADLVRAQGLKGGGMVKLLVMPQNLPTGIYEATVTVDGGPLGVQNFPVKLTVTPPATTGPQVNAIVHAATFATGGIVPGSLATIWGQRLGGKNVSVTFDGTPTTLLYTGDVQINLYIPASLAGHTSTQVVVSVDGGSTVPFTVQLAAAAPAVFAGGILNQDNSLNTAANAAAGNSVIQIFATGIPSNDIAKVTAKIHDFWIPVPDYAGPAPGLTGVQQVNLRVPTGWPPMATTVVLCTTLNSTGVRVCGPEAPLYLK